MADEAAVQTTTQSVGETIAPVAPAQPSENVSAYSPDLGDIDISEAALRGEESAAPAEAPSLPVVPETPAEAPTPTEVPPASSEPKGAEGEAKPAATPETAPEGDEKPGKPPKGFVPLAAVHEARKEIDYLKAQLQAVIQQPPAPAEPVAQESPWKDFKELSQAEFTNLVTEDPTAAILYTTQLVGFKEFTQQQATKAVQENAVKTLEKAFVDTAYSRMEAAVPGLFSEGEAAKELAEFASEIGFGPDLFPLTDPNVRIILPGQTKAQLLGEGAASLVEMLAQLRGKMRTQATSESALREQLTKEITEKVQLELLEKFKKQAPGFTTLASVPGTTPESGADPLAGKVLTSDELAGLSPAALERYLAGA